MTADICITWWARPGAATRDPFFILNSSRSQVIDVQDKHESELAMLHVYEVKAKKVVENR